MTILYNSRRAYNIWKRFGWRVLRRKIGRRIIGDGSWIDYKQDAMIFATWMDFSQKDILASQELHKIYPGELDIHTITWFLPDFENPYYGGIYTLLRFADYFTREKGIENHFAILGDIQNDQAAAKISQSFPALAGQQVSHFNLYEHMGEVEPTDVGIATLWGTAYFLLRFNQTKRKFFFIQDHEPLFYPAGSISAQVEAALRFGYYGICNTPTIKNIYEEQFDGQAEYFLPCVDIDVFYPPEDYTAQPYEPMKIFFYGRPNHPRNGFELGAQALRLLKKRLGDRVRIIAAGGNWEPKDYALDGIVENLGLLTYKQTAELYRRCHVGLVMMLTRHPSYLPFELMASGCLVVSNFNPATTWFLKDKQNCRLASTSATCVADVLEESLLDHEQRESIARYAANQINTDYSSWGDQIEKIYQYMCDPAQN